MTDCEALIYEQTRFDADQVADSCHFILGVMKMGIIPDVQRTEVGTDVTTKDLPVDVDKLIASGVTEAKHRMPPTLPVATAAGKLTVLAA